MSLVDLPNECLVEIVQFLPMKDMSNVMITCKQFLFLQDFIDNEFDKRKRKLYDTMGISERLQRFKKLRRLGMLTICEEDISLLEELSTEDLNNILISPVANPLNELFKLIIKHDYSHIQHISNPTLELQLFAIAQDPNAIMYIRNPDIGVQLIAVSQDGNAIQCIKNPPFKVQLAAVKQNPDTIEYIMDRILTPKLKVQLAAVKKDGLLIRFIRQSHPKVQLAAVKQNPFSIFYINNPSIDTQMYVVQKDINLCKFIDEPDKSLLLYLHSKLNDDVTYIVTDYLYKHRKTLLKLI